jgi:membrane protein required for colicin V production
VTLFDYLVLGILGLSILLSVMRGLTQELLALAAWGLSFWLASAYSQPLSGVMPQSLPSESLRYMAAFIVIFCGVWLVSAIVRITLNQFLKASGLKPVDRLLGAGFGCLRGLFLVITAVLVAGMTNLPREPFWRDAMFSPLCEALAGKVKPWLPEAVAGKIRFEA